MDKREFRFNDPCNPCKETVCCDECDHFPKKESEKLRVKGVYGQASFNRPNSGDDSIGSFLEKLVDKLFVKTVYWETFYHAHLLKITTYAHRSKPNRVREYVWANNYGSPPKFSEISIYHLDSSLKYIGTIKRKERFPK